MRGKDNRVSMYFVYRSERLSWKIGDTALSTPRTVVERGRRKWRVTEGDFLLFTEGRGMELRFVALSPVLRVESTVVKEDDGEITIVTVTVGSPSLLPEGLLLSRFMYNLIAVSNFGRPWLHLRHKARVGLVDVNMLREVRIVWDRTVFFGLLRELPDRWREILEAESRVRHVAEHPREPIQPWTPPVRELLGLLELTIVSPALLAAEVHSAWLDVLGPDTLAAIQVVDAEGGVEPWNILSLLRIAARTRESLEGHWARVVDLPFTESLEGGVRWRPHRW